MQIKWLKTALLDLDDEAAYITRNNPRAAALTVKRITQTIELLNQRPLRADLVELRTLEN